MNWYIGVLKKYAVFSGRAQRAEYWYFALFSIIISVVLSVVDNILNLGGNMGVGVLSGIYSLAVLIPSLAVGVRRLHDTDRSGWWLLIGLIPLIGFIVLLIWFVTDSKPGENKYGQNPKGVADTTAAPAAAPAASVPSTPQVDTPVAPAAPAADTPADPPAAT